jgi:hypothetical protein
VQTKLAKALSVTVEALCQAQTSRYDERASRDKLFNDTLAIVREFVGLEFRLTTMTRKCMHCETVVGEKEGNGATGETATICPPCLEQHWPTESAIVKSQGVPTC